MRNPVRLNQARAQRHKHLSHHRLAGSDAPGKANFQHEAPKEHFHHGDTEPRRKNKKMVPP
jgi:hypothetical protein